MNLTRLVSAMLAPHCSDHSHFNNVRLAVEKLGEPQIFLSGKADPEKRCIVRGIGNLYGHMILLEPVTQVS